MCGHLQEVQGTFPALIQGEVDVIAGFVTVSIFNAINKGANVRYVADKGHADADGCSADTILVNSEIHEIFSRNQSAAVEHYRVSMRKTTVEEYLVEQVIEPEKIQLVNVKTPAELDALKNNKIDMAVVSEPWKSRIIISNAGHPWKRVSEIYPGFQFGAVIYGPNLLQKNPDLGVRFMTAYLKGVRQYNEGKTERNKTILSKHIRLNSELLKQVFWPQISSDLSLNTNSIDDYQRWAKRKGYLDEVIPTERYQNMHYVEAALLKIE